MGSTASVSIIGTMWNLAASLIVLVLGPLVVAKVRNLRPAAVALDAFVIVAIGGLVFLHILPESLAQGGWAAAAALVAGLFGPLLAERGLRPGLDATSGRIVLTLALAGLAAHAVIDGLAIGLEHGHHHHGHGHGHHHHDHDTGGLLSLAVLLHRLPVGIAIWWLIPRTLGVRVAIIALTLIGVATVAGFFMGGMNTGSEGLAIFQALLAGSLLHVVFHSHLPRQERTGSWDIASAVGTLAALGILVAVTLSHHSEVTSQAGHTFIAFALQSAPALLASYLLVGFVHVLLPGERLGSGKGSSFGQALRGVVAGLPVPVCSCGIVPLYRELVMKGAPVAAAMAFLVATPELEVAAFLLTVQLLGTEFAVARLVAAAILALLAGWLVGRSAKALLAATPDASAKQEDPEDNAPRTLGAVVNRSLRFGFGEAVDHTAAWILLGLGIAALATPFLDPAWLGGVPPVLQGGGAALLGLPLYVCASGSTPLAAVLIFNGLSPGAAVALLLTGPATNVTTFGMLSELHGRRIALGFAALVTLGAIGLGLLTDAVLPAGGAAGFAAAHHHESATPLRLACAAALGAVFLASLLRQGTRPFIERVAVSRGEQDGHHDACHDAPTAPPCCH